MDEPPEVRLEGLFFPSVLHRQGVEEKDTVCELVVNGEGLVVPVAV